MSWKNVLSPLHLLIHMLRSKMHSISIKKKKILTQYLMLIQSFQKHLCYCCALMKLNVVLVSAQASQDSFQDF